MITEFIESFDGLTKAGNLTTEIIDVSISLIEELNELMMLEMELSVNQSEMKVTLISKVMMKQIYMNETEY